MTLAKEMKKMAEGSPETMNIIYYQVIAGIMEEAKRGNFGIFVEFDSDSEASEIKKRLESESFDVGVVRVADHSIEVSWNI